MDRNTNSTRGPTRLFTPEILNKRHDYTLSDITYVILYWRIQEWLSNFQRNSHWWKLVLSTPPGDYWLLEEVEADGSAGERNWPRRAMTICCTAWNTTKASCARYSAQGCCHHSHRYLKENLAMSINVAGESERQPQIEHGITWFNMAVRQLAFRK